MGRMWGFGPRCGTIGSIKLALFQAFFGQKNSMCKKLKPQEKNSNLKLKIQISGTFEEKRNFGKLTETTIIVRRGTERPKF